MSRSFALWVQKYTVRCRLSFVGWTVTFTSRFQSSTFNIWIRFYKCLRISFLWTLEISSIPYVYSFTSSHTIFSVCSSHLYFSCSKKLNFVNHAVIKSHKPLNFLEEKHISQWGLQVWIVVWTYDNYDFTMVRLYNLLSDSYYIMQLKQLI